MGYCWVRELEKAKAQHYHMKLWFDGDLLKTSHYVRKYAKQVWEEMSGTFPSLPKTYIYINSPETRLEALYWLSYLAKGRGKEAVPWCGRSSWQSRTRCCMCDELRLDVCFNGRLNASHH